MKVSARKNAENEAEIERRLAELREEDRIARKNMRLGIAPVSDVALARAARHLLATLKPVIGFRRADNLPEIVEVHRAIAALEDLL